MRRGYVTVITVKSIVDLIALAAVIAFGLLALVADNQSMSLSACATYTIYNIAIRIFSGRTMTYADYDEQISNEWLQSVGFQHRAGTNRYALSLGDLTTIPEFVHGVDCRKWYVDRCGGYFIPADLCPTTRGEAHVLFAKLGIPLQGKQARYASPT